MSDWIEAAEQQLALARWLDSDAGQDWTRNWIEQEKLAEPEKGKMFAFLMHAEVPRLLAADPIWVSPDMCDVVDFARQSDTFKATAVHDDDFITKQGFLFFAKPIYIKDRQGYKIPIGGFSWSRLHTMSKEDALKAVEAGEADMTVNSIEGDEAHVTIETHDGTTEEVLPTEPYGMGITLYTSVTGDEGKAEYVEKLREYKAFSGTDLCPMHMSQVVFGEPFDDGDLYDVRNNYTGADEWWKLMQATLLLMAQRISTRETARLPRPTRRRMQRDGHMMDDVVIIRLRRSSSRRKDSEETGRKLTHRHMRTDFWRNQWYASVQRHKQIWIPPTVVGDENLPLVLKKRYYKWDR